MYVCTVGMCSCSCVCAHVCPPFMIQHLLLNVELIDCARLVGSKAQESSCLSLPSTVIIGVCCSAQLLTEVL